MKFIEAFLQAGIVVFALPLVFSWVVKLIGEPKMGRRNKGHNILTVLICGGLVLGIFYINYELGGSLLFLASAWLLLIMATAFKLSYEENYGLKDFLRGFSIKIIISLIIGFFIKNN